MNLAVLRTYAVQLEEVAKLELAELSRALQRTVERMATLESLARADAERYLAQVREGSTVTQVYGQLDAMDQAIAARKGMEQAHAVQQKQWAAPRKAASRLSRKRFRCSSIWRTSRGLLIAGP